MSTTALPVDYETCRTRFRAAAAQAQIDVRSHPLIAAGPAGEVLTIDVTAIGSTDPNRALVVLSGVHGVEGFIGSALQTDLISRLDARALPDDLAIVLVHAVNPWGMAHNRRQNEHNVDLNRNWRRSERDPEHNAAYDELHWIACPDTPELPSVAGLLETIEQIVAERGAAWVSNGITRGQYRHPDGLHFGGDRTEQSCEVLERVVPELIGSADTVLTVDVHTGVGRRGVLTVLSGAPPGSPHDEFVRSNFGETDETSHRALVTSPAKPGSIAAGLAASLPAADSVAITAEFGTTGDLEQLGATYLEQWVHRHGNLDDPRHRSARTAYRDCFTPPDAEWQHLAFEAGRTLLDEAIESVQQRR